MPLSGPYRELVGSEGTRYALTGGEDYELLFCARQSDRQLIDRLQHQVKVPLTRIGACVPANQGISCLDRSGQPISVPAIGYDHFKSKTDSND